MNIKNYTNYLNENDDLPNFDDLENGRMFPIDDDVSIPVIDNPVDDTTEKIINDLSQYVISSKDTEKEEKKISRSEDGNIKLRMTTKLKKIFIKLEKNKNTKDIAERFIKGIRKHPCDISFFNMTDNNETLSCLTRDRIIGLERITDKDGKSRLGVYKSNQRQDIRLGRIINRVFPGEFSARKIEQFVNEFKAEHDMITGNIGIELVDGKDIAYWYDHRRYNKKGGGTLNNSCMRDVGAKRLKLYTDNPDKIKLAIYTRNGKLEARALVWNCDDGSIYMDRVYYTQDHIQNSYQNYAQNNGWSYYGGRGNNRGKTVTLRRGKSYNPNETPYLDTFTYDGRRTLTSR